MRHFIATVLPVALLATPPSFAQEAMAIQVKGDASAELQRGIEFGISEVSQTARLLGREVRLAQAADAPLSVQGIVVAAPRGLEGPVTVPVIHIAPLPPSAGDCEFSVAIAPDDRSEPGIVRWHHSLNRFGASELNERFTSRYRRGMSDSAWAGWIAVKALVESALRNRDSAEPCAALGRLRFDGHKGRALRFDPRTRVLSQPLYRVKNGRAIEDTK